MSYEQATLVALFLGPVFGVFITLWYQQRMQKRLTKERLFIQLMGHRKGLSVEWVNGLNVIDVIYADHPKVVEAWHDFYDYLHIRPMDPKQFEHRVVTLLSEMATSLGYASLKQVDIDKVYSPEAHGAQAKMNEELQTEFLRVLKSTQSLSAIPQKPDPPVVIKIKDKQ